jgi:hypothetical protein
MKNKYHISGSIKRETTSFNWWCASIEIYDQENEIEIDSKKYCVFTRWEARKVKNILKIWAETKIESLIELDNLDKELNTILEELKII